MFINLLNFIKIKHLIAFSASFITSLVIFEIILSSDYLGKYLLNKSNITTLVWWTRFMPSRELVCYGGQFKCLISNNKSAQNVDGYLFYGSHIEGFPLPRNNKVWAIFHEESPKNWAPLLYENVQKLFNFSATFSRKSDFPLTLQYLKDIKYLLSREFFVPLQQKNTLISKGSHSPIVYIQSSCDTPSDRDFLVEKLGKYMKIDSFGKCLNNKQFPKKISNVYELDLYNHELLHFISQYKFVIAIENAICTDYITEKLWRPLVVGSIPIYLGSPTIEDWLPNNKSAILIKNFQTIESLATFISEINNNDDLYNSYLDHKLNDTITNDKLIKNYNLLKRNEENSEEPVINFECFVCKMVIEEQFSKTTMIAEENIYNCENPKNSRFSSKNNTWDQHWEVGKCQAKALSTLIKKNVHFSKKIFENTWKNYLNENNC